MVGRGRFSRLKQTDVHENSTFGGEAKVAEHTSCARIVSLPQNVDNQKCVTTLFQKTNSKISNENILRVSEEELLKELSSRGTKGTAESTTMIQSDEKKTMVPNQNLKNPSLTQYIQSHRESVFGFPKTKEFPRNKEYNQGENKRFSHGHLANLSKRSFTQDQSNIPKSFVASKYDRSKFKWVSPNLKARSQFALDINKESQRSPSQLEGVQKNDMNYALSESSTKSDSCDENSLEDLEKADECQEDHLCDSFIRSSSLVNNRKLKEGVIRVEDLEKGCDEELLVSDNVVQEDWEEEIARDQRLLKEQDAMQRVEEVTKNSESTDGVSIGRKLLEMITNPKGLEEDMNASKIPDYTKSSAQHSDEENLIDASHSDTYKTSESSLSYDSTNDSQSEDSYTTEDESYSETEDADVDDCDGNEQKVGNDENAPNSADDNYSDSMSNDDDDNDENGMLDKNGRKGTSRRRRRKRRRSEESVVEDHISEAEKNDKTSAKLEIQAEVKSIVPSKKHSPQKPQRKELYIPYESAPRFERRQWKTTKLYNWRTNKVEVIHHGKNQKYYCKENNIKPANKPNKPATPKKQPTQSKKKTETEKGFVMPVDFPPIMKAANKNILEKCPPSRSAAKTKNPSITDASKLTAEQVSLSVSENMNNMEEELKRLNGEIRESLVNFPSFADVSKSNFKKMDTKYRGYQNSGKHELGMRKFDKNENNSPKVQQTSTEQIDTQLTEIMKDVTLPLEKVNEIESDRKDTLLPTSYGHTNLLDQPEKSARNAEDSPGTCENDREVVIKRYEHSPAMAERNVLHLLADESFNEDETRREIAEYNSDAPIYDMEIKDDVMMMQALTIEGDSKELTDRIDQSYGVFKNHWSPDDDDKMFWMDFTNQLKQDQEILILNEKQVPKSLSKEKICTKNCYFDTGKKLHLCSPESIKC